MINRIFSTKKERRSWCSKRFLEMIGDSVPLEAEEQAIELIQKHRVLDFMIQPGRASVKVHDEAGKAHRVEIVFKQISDREWQKVFSGLASQSYYLALILSGQVPEEFEGILREYKLSLFPEKLPDLAVYIDGARTMEVTPAVAALLHRVAERLDNDPFSVFILKGRGREETVAEIRKGRSSLVKQKDTGNDIVLQGQEYEPAPPLSETVNRFWSRGEALKELSYTIRADELPASILKWLDPPPLLGLENEVDSLLEEAYERVARLAQAFGLRL